MRKVLIGTVVLGVAVAAYAKEKPAPAVKPAATVKPAPAPPPAEMATAELKNVKGEKVGDATMVETPHGVLVTLNLVKMPPGTHAIHIHEVGKCEPPFKTAGGHLNPGGKHHGIMNPEGKHEGDLPNLDVPADGKLTVEFLAGAATLKKEPKNSLLDADGTSLVIHLTKDDHMSDPAGNAGDRIACGVIVEKK